MRILIVDDSAYARQRLSKVLRDAGYEVIEAVSGPEAIELFQKSRFNAVTVDMLMPEMDGITLMKKIREIDRDIPLIAVTADIQEETKKDAFEAGAFAFISKTAPPEEIRSVFSKIEEEPEFMFFSMKNKDDFTELINIAMGRAASALSSLIERKIILRVPHFEMIKASKLHDYFENNLKSIGVAVQQRFSGVINGIATLAFPHKDAVSLVRALLSKDKEIDRLTPSEQTVLAEVGNIVLNAAISILSNQLNTRFSISVPDVYLKKSGTEVLNYILFYTQDTEHAIVLLSHLTISDIEIISYLILLIPRVGILKLLESLNV
ncbi:MAG: response regulator [Syntrophorhabdaceae bacterium]|nr:response regulator [Syntrophorhabdaceae bacterium]